MLEIGSHGRKKSMRGRYGVIQIAIVLVLGSGFAAQAQAHKADPQACTAIIKANERLNCFDRAFPKQKVTAPAKAETAPIDLKLFVNKERQCDLKAIYEAVKKAVGTKSEFETKEAFSERGLKQLTAAGIPTTGIFCKARNALLSYDAEKGGYPIDGLPPYKDSTESLGTIDGKSSTGTIVKIEHELYKSWSANYQYGNKPVAQIPVSEAKKLGDKLAQGDILNIVSPFYDSYNLDSQPTISNPILTDSIIGTVWLEPTHVLLYNTETYEILWSRPVVKCGSTYISFMVGECLPFDRPWKKQ